MPVLLDRRNRSGRITSPSVLVPSNASGRLRVIASLTQAELDNPASRFAININVLNPTTGLWDFSAGATFVGGPSQGKGGTATMPPGFIVNAVEYAGRQVQGELVFPDGVTVRMGVDYDIISPA